jgi:hypothetical protein
MLFGVGPALGFPTANFGHAPSEIFMHPTNAIPASGTVVSPQPSLESQQ